jgi:hypothetical protein
MRVGRHNFAQYLGAFHRLRPSCRRSLPRLTGEGLPYRRFSHGWGWDPISRILHDVFPGPGQVACGRRGDESTMIIRAQYKSNQFPSRPGRTIVCLARPGRRERIRTRPSLRTVGVASQGDCGVIHSEPVGDPDAGGLHAPGRLVMIPPRPACSRPGGVASDASGRTPAERDQGPDRASPGPASGDSSPRVAKSNPGVLWSGWQEG